MALNFKAQQIEILTHKNSHVNVVRSCLQTPEKKTERGSEKVRQGEGRRAKSKRLPIAGRDERRGALEFFVHAPVLVLVLLLFILSLILILILALVQVLVLVLVSGT